MDNGSSKMQENIFSRNVSFSLLPQNPSNKSSQLSDSSRTDGGLLQNPKTRGFRELFLPESDFKTCSTVVNFSKNHPDFGSLETNQRNKIQT